jgi:hypothetical protein
MNSYNDLAEFARQMGHKGGNITKAKYGPAHYSKMGKLSVAVRAAKKKATKRSGKISKLDK